MAAIAQLLEGLAGHQALDVEQVTVQVARGHQPVVERQARHDAAHHLEDDGGAVGRQGVVELRLVFSDCASSR